MKYYKCCKLHFEEYDHRIFDLVGPLVGCIMHRFFSEMATLQNLLYTADSTICCTTVYRAGYRVMGCPVVRAYLADLFYNWCHGSPGTLSVQG